MDQIEQLKLSADEALQRACESAGISSERLLGVMPYIGAAFSEVSQVFRDLSDAVHCFLQQIAFDLSPVIKGLPYYSEEYWDFVPPKVRHLAFHHPKARVRNKNWNRMWRIHKRYINARNDSTQRQHSH
jgi:hypothetical protein